MKLVWLARARADRANAIAYIAQANPRAALGQLEEIERQVDLLAEHPEIGRQGRMRATRELVIIRTPFILVYRIRARVRRIEILRLLHGAQKWPSPE